MDLPFKLSARLIDIFNIDASLLQTLIALHHIVFLDFSVARNDAMSEMLEMVNSW
jgi:hypothetical protein